MTTLSPRESGSFIAQHAEHVTIDEQGIRCAAELVGVTDTMKLCYDL